MSAPSTRSRPRGVGRLILRRLFDAAHTRPRPPLFERLKPPGAEPNASAS
ncbi:MAG TPA: hypothetical protein VF306_08545 [Pirellulales bacterium]